MTLSLSVLLGIIIIALIAKWDLGKGAAIVCILFGITIANTEIATWLMNLVDSIAGLAGQVKF